MKKSRFASAGRLFYYLDPSLDLTFLLLGVCFGSFNSIFMDSLRQQGGAEFSFLPEKFPNLIRVIGEVDKAHGAIDTTGHSRVVRLVHALKSNGVSVEGDASIQIPVRSGDTDSLDDWMNDLRERVAGGFPKITFVPGEVNSSGLDMARGFIARLDVRLRELADDYLKRNRGTSTISFYFPCNGEFYKDPEVLNELQGYVKGRFAELGCGGNALPSRLADSQPGLTILVCQFGQEPYTGSKSTGW